MSPPASDPPPREPAWRALALGWLLAQALLAQDAASPRLPSAGLSAAAPDPPLRGGAWGALPPRALRSWPGIGETRALAVARARWEHPDDGAPLYLSDVPGVGATTELAVGAWLASGRPGPRGGE